MRRPAAGRRRARGGAIRGQGQRPAAERHPPRLGRPPSGAASSGSAQVLAVVPGNDRARGGGQDLTAGSRCGEACARSPLDRPDSPARRPDSGPHNRRAIAAGHVQPGDHSPSVEPERNRRYAQPRLRRQGPQRRPAAVGGPDRSGDPIPREPAAPDGDRLPPPVEPNRDRSIARPPSRQPPELDRLRPVPVDPRSATSRTTSPPSGAPTRRQLGAPTGRQRSSPTRRRRAAQPPAVRAPGTRDGRVPRPSPGRAQPLLGRMPTDPSSHASRDGHAGARGPPLAREGIQEQPTPSRIAPCGVEPARPRPLAFNARKVQLCSPSWIPPRAFSLSSLSRRSGPTSSRRAAAFAFKSNMDEDEQIARGPGGFPSSPSEGSRARRLGPILQVRAQRTVRHRPRERVGQSPSRAARKPTPPASASRVLPEQASNRPGTPALGTAPSPSRWISPRQPRIAARPADQRKSIACALPAGSS